MIRVVGDSDYRVRRLTNDQFAGSVLVQLVLDTGQNSCNLVFVVAPGKEFTF